MINFAGDFDGHGHGDGTCKQALIHQTATYPRTGCHDMTPIKKIITTRMHSSRMRTARSLNVSHCIRKN